MFYYCRHCKQLVYVVKKTGANLVCCGENMQELVANTTDAANEKHVPVVTKENNKVHVKVGSVTHPMIPEHYIMWIAIKTNKGVYIHHLNPSDAPETTFVLNEDEVLEETFEFCNLHMLWAYKN